MSVHTERELAALLAAAIETEAEYPSSLKLLEQLQATKTAAQLLLLAIASQQFRPLLTDGNEQLKNEREGAAFLRDIAARVARAQERNPRASGAGRPKAIMLVSGEWPSARKICALMIGIRWRLERGNWPGQHNSEAQGYCEELWKAAGGAPHGEIASPNGALTAWRPHLRVAKQYEGHPVGAFLSGIITAPIRQRITPLSRRYYTHPRSPRATDGVVLHLRGTLN